MACGSNEGGVEHHAAMLCRVAIAEAGHEGGSRACRRPHCVCISLQGGLSRVLILGMMGILPSCVVALWFPRFKVDSSGRTIAMIDDVPSMPEGETEPLRY